MTGEETIFARALEIESQTARAQFLRAACAGDEPLFQRLEGLLRAHEGAGKFADYLRPEESPTAKGATHSAITLTEKAGDQIGRYKLLQKIGEGGCGVIYMAEQEEPVRR